jgi:formamidopyrimidine-DNA glycosylase
MPNGDKLAFITVGGRTSCYAPEVQKKSGHIAPGVKEEPLVSDEEPAEKKPAKRKATSKAKTKKEDVVEKDSEPQKKKRKAEKDPVDTSRTTNGKTTKKTKKQEDSPGLKTEEGGSSRRSRRLSGKTA